ncbi:MAG: hypothetical protein U9O59_01975 [Actinomycetota bacterium]|nr:hypothetical protein [Actinomycetota bacterium]
MKKILVFITVFLFSAFLFASPLFAYSSESGEDVTISGEALNDVYAFGNSVKLIDDIGGDFIAAAGMIEVSGNVDGDLMAAGGTIDVSGDIGDDIRAAGGRITIDSDVEDDLMVAGGQISISGDTKIGGDLVVTGGTVSVDGEIEGRLIASGGDITIEGIIGKGVQIDYVNSLTVTSAADIGGDLSYSSSNEASISKNAEIAGDVKFSLIELPSEEKEAIKEALLSFFAATYFGGKLISFLSLFILGILLILAMPKVFEKFNDRMKNTLGYSIGAGAIMLFGAPVVVSVLMVISVLLFVTLIGSGVGIAATVSYILLLIFYILLIYVSTIFLSYLLGKIILMKTSLKFDKYGWKVLAFLIGLVIICVVYNIPFIGWLIRLAGILFGLGALALVIKDWLAAYRK